MKNRQYQTRNAHFVAGKRLYFMKSAQYLYLYGAPNLLRDGINKNGSKTPPDCSPARIPRFERNRDNVSSHQTKNFRLNEAPRRGS